jgi:hypothetical protein
MEYPSTLIRSTDTATGLLLIILTDKKKTFLHFFLSFWIFFGFFWVFLGFFAQTRGFLGFFSVSQILLGASRL